MREPRPARPRRVGRWPLQAALGSTVADAIHRWWACCWPNRLADRAGRYRRFAVALVVLTAPLLASGLALILGPVAGRGHGAAHLAVAVCCAWLANDLVRSASVIDGRGRPHPSGLALVLALLLLETSRPAPVEVGEVTGAVALAGPTALALAVGLAVLVVAEWRLEPVLVLLGRGIVVAGAVMVGGVGLGQLARSPWGAPIHPVDLTITSLVLLATAAFEARVLVRGLVLSQVVARR